METLATAITIYIILLFFAGPIGDIYRAIKNSKEYQKELNKQQDLREISGVYFWK